MRLQNNDEAGAGPQPGARTLDQRQRTHFISGRLARLPPLQE
ncbi:MAG: hypothetical protein Q8O85_07095 [Rhodoferax sp.]|nr:hypothetical protein [Rhodoferax sp.]MDP2678476.1 hypothetical protein [Rhodoferax sp.]